MDIQIIRRDVEGDLVQFDAQPIQYGKQLPLDVAWNIDDPNDLEYLLWQLVQAVKHSFDHNVLHIHYKPSIKPLGLLQLREIIQLERPLALWRVVKLAIDLCESLKEFHMADLPQMLVHPERVGRLGNKFILLPTLSGILPPLSQMPDNNIAGWLHYIAPEVLRTRGNNIALLPLGDIYSLGRMIHVLTVSGYEPLNSGGPHALAEQLVETFSVASSDGWPAGSDRLQTIVAKMCSFLPEERPSLDEILFELRAIVGQVEPEVHIRQLITQNNLSDAGICLEELQDDQQRSVFEFARAKIYLLKAELALSRLTPDYVQVIDHLNNALSFEPKNAEMNIKLAQTYAQLTTHPQHLLLASKSYAQAAELADWREDIVVAWSDVLEQLNNSKEVLYQTQHIPWERQSHTMFLLRTRCYLEIEEYNQAWEETTHYFEKFGFNKEIYDLAKTAASEIKPLTLVRWMHQHKEAPGLDAAISIVWARNGNLELAKEHLTKALLAQQQTQEEK